MNAPFTMDDLVSRNMNPEKLETLRRVFETVCVEAEIPENAKSERNELADKILTAGVSVGDGRRRADLERPRDQQSDERPRRTLHRQAAR